MVTKRIKIPLLNVIVRAKEKNNNTMMNTKHLFFIFLPKDK